jgi:uncharacterized protein (UPF0333 family)
MDSFIEEENGQSLVIVLLMIVIAVIIAIAISFRTIQDIRRAGEEKASSRAGNQTESVLEVISSPGVINDVVAECDIQWGSGNNICEFSKNELQQDYLTDAVSIDVCDELDLLLKREDGINKVLVSQDDVFELDLTKVKSADSFSISWGGDASNLIVKVYKKDCEESGPDDRNSMDCTDEARLLSTATPTEVNFSSEAYIARIKPIGGDASITITNLPGDVVYIVSAKAKCYTKGADGGDIYREFVRRIRLNPTLPACFDYVLFSGAGKVKKGV